MNMETIEETPIIQRLKQFIGETGLSSTQFADKCGIPRPSFSQMLSGRNKSINNQVLSKLNEAFPELDIMWLLFGKENKRPTSNLKNSEPQIASTFIQSGHQEPGNQHVNQTQTSQSALGQGYTQPSGQPTQANESIWQASVLCSPPESEGAAPRTVLSEPAKRISSIIVLYTDNSFETFKAPE